MKLDFKEGYEHWYLCDRRSLNNHPRNHDTAMERSVTTMKKIGMIHSSLSLSYFDGEVDYRRHSTNIPGDKEKATLENKRQGVKRETLSLLSCCV